MAFDGITAASLVCDLKAAIEGGSISRIIQPERDELQLQIKKNREQFYLAISANASMPLLYLAEARREAPMTAPNFCMLLRKHLQGGLILDISQPSLERIIIFTIRHRDELGDLRDKKLIVEIMGKHSNIIFTDDGDRIIDSIKRVPFSMSSVREVLPGKQWFIPAQDGKVDPKETGSAEEFRALMEKTQVSIVKGLYGTFTGLSPVAAEELAYEAGADPRKGWADLGENERERLAQAFLTLSSRLKNEEFTPVIVMEGREPKEFGCLPLTMFSHAPYTVVECGDTSSMIRTYYGSREKINRMRQKSADLRHVVTLAYDRASKKLELQERQMKDTEKREKYRIWGEMLNAYGYQLEEGAKELTCVNYYTDEEITVPLDPTLNASGNSRKYFARYNKLKRTAEAMVGQIAETAADRDQLASILMAIEIAETEADLAELRSELENFGFVQRKTHTAKGARREARSVPYAYRSSDGFQLLVGRNNYQNDELSFKIAGSNDWWFHVKGAPGSHVILRTEGRDVPDRAFEEAGALAAWYSSERRAPKVEVDYTLRKNLRRKNGGKPGFVIYHTNYSLMAEPDISRLQRI